MDDFLDVPDDWLNQRRKRDSGHLQESLSDPTLASTPKKNKKDANYNESENQGLEGLHGDLSPQTNGIDESHRTVSPYREDLPDLTNGSKSDVVENGSDAYDFECSACGDHVNVKKNTDNSVIEISSTSETSLRTQEDSSINEPDFLGNTLPAHIPHSPNIADVEYVDNKEEKSEGSASEQAHSVVGLSRVDALPPNNVADVAKQDVPDMKKVASVLRDAKIISGIVSYKNLNNVYDLLLDNRERPDRLDFVTSVLLDGSGKGGLDDIQKTPGVQLLDIFEEVELVIKSVSNADANEVYALLESVPPSSTRVKCVIEILKQKPILIKESETKTVPVLLKKDSSIIDDPLLANDPLFCDMRTVAKIFPDKDRNEIYALLEAHFEKKDRLQTVIDELMMTYRGEDQSQNSQAHVAQAEEPNPPSEESSVERDVEKMQTLFPDCDPNYLFERLEQMGSVKNRTDVLAAELFDRKNYPTLKDLEEKEEEKTRLDKLRNLKITVEEFQQKFPEPEKTFGDITKDLSPSYKQHADLFLKNEFRILQAGYLKSVLERHQGHVLPAYREISSALLSIPIAERKQHKRFLKNRRGILSMPTIPDEYFYHEMWFIHNEQNIADHENKKVQQRQMKLEEAKAKGELYECCCCFEDECLFEDLASCADGHLFCKTCVLRSTEAAFGEMKTKFPCLTGACDQHITLNTIQSIVPSNLFSKIIRRMQEEEVQQANIPDLVICPFCPFATIMSDKDDKVLKCLNPECLKESCRLCQEPNHIPLRCNEVEKKAETNMRTFIENYISEAVMRKCHRCGKRFVKENGCNKMTCHCGATSCYACKEPDINYDHFNANKKCAQTDPNWIHQQDMERAALEAKNKYLEDHPEATEVELKNDVVDMIKDYKDQTGGPFNPNMRVYEDSDEERDSDDYDEEHDYDDYDEPDRYMDNEKYEDSSSDEDVLPFIAAAFY
ncbi:uncharacterized protein LOC101849460 [Aplysia californica]|uniref:Uncharacterized protein LOC101849460 n=1 Tax=Aplysia californica TaxID=6500 RepID=A0ABM0JPP9_APLCA|nr:uncharacterized protein LOC101849460 [Aplysia californica]XP_005098624.1 uncharacterized protein LOC101849460 [Aplysia californica]